jgi:hypothetical protein
MRLKTFRVIVVVRKCRRISIAIAAVGIGTVVVKLAAAAAASTITATATATTAAASAVVDGVGVAAVAKVGVVDLIAQRPPRVVRRCRRAAQATNLRRRCPQWRRRRTKPPCGRRPAKRTYGSRFTRFSRGGCRRGRAPFRRRRSRKRPV